MLRKPVNFHITTQLLKINRLDYGEQNLVWAADKVDNKFDTWKGLISNNLSSKNIPAKIKDNSVGPKSQDGLDHDIKEKIQFADVKQNWTKYQLTHGGALNGSVIGRYLLAKTLMIILIPPKKTRSVSSLTSIERHGIQS